MSSLTKHTTPFAARHDLEEQYQELRRSIAHILDKMWDLHWERNEKYDNYINNLKRVLPRSANKALTAVEIYNALGYSDTEENLASIQASLAGLATGANNARINFDFASKDGEKYCASDHSRLVGLTNSYREVTHHYAELDENGEVVHKWDEDTNEPVYWFDEDWDHHINDDDEYDDDDDEDWGEEDNEEEDEDED